MNESSNVFDLISSAVENLADKTFSLSEEKEETKDEVEEKELESNSSLSNAKEERRDLISQFEDLFNVDFGNEKRENDIQRHLLDLLRRKPEEEEDEEFSIIAKAASNTEEEKEKVDNKIVGSDDPKLDDIFTEIIDFENGKEIKEKEDIDVASLLDETNEEVDTKTLFDEVEDEEIELINEGFKELIDEIENKEKSFERKHVDIKNVDEDVVINTLDLIIEKDRGGITLKPKIIERSVKDNKEEFVYKKEAKNIEKVDENEVVKNAQDIIGELPVLKKEEFVYKKEAKNIERIKEDEVVKNIEDIIGDISNLKITPKKEIVFENNSVYGNDYNSIYDERTIDQIYIANPGTEILDEFKTKESKPEEKLQNISNEEDVELIKIEDNLQDLLDELNEDEIVNRIEEIRNEEKAQKNKIYDSVKTVYTYLDKSFIKGVFDLKNLFAYEYPLDENIIILQRISFNDVEKLRSFVEVILSHDYVVNVDEEKMIVDVIKGCVNKDGLILAEIFEVANQGKLLEGEYEGYRIIIEGSD